MAEIALENVSKVYPDGTRAVQRLDLEVEDGELMVFVGPSGCGKTSALRMIAGLEEITGGDDPDRRDEVVNELPPKDRDVAMIFQNYALYPHMNAVRQHGVRAQDARASTSARSTGACATRPGCSGSTTC